jgi:predicted amidohydrolase
MSRSDKLKIGVCQLLVGSDKTENIKNAARLIDETGDAQLVVRYFNFTALD